MLCCGVIISIRTGQKFTHPNLAELKLLYLISNSSVFPPTKLLKSYWNDGYHFLSGFIPPYTKQRGSQPFNWPPLVRSMCDCKPFAESTYHISIIEINPWCQWEHEVSRSLVSTTRLSLQWNWIGLASFSYRLSIGFRSVYGLRMRSDFLCKLILPYSYFIIMFDSAKIQRKFKICKKNEKKVSYIKNY